MDYIAQPKDYWIALQAIKITLNALGNPNRMQGSVASGAAILCYIEGVDGLGYDNGHRFRTWPLAISPTYFNSNTEKYVYVAIPRSEAVGTQAIVVFPSEQLDIYGKNVGNAQIGSTDYYYIWLQGIITATDGTSNREWQQAIDFGKKGTDEDLYDDTTSEWYVYSKVSEVVTFLKNITMKTGTTFHNLILGYKELTGVTSFDTAYTDSDTLVATPGYVDSQYLSKTHESTAQEETGFVKGLWVKVKGLFGIDADGNIKGNDADLLGDLNVGGDTTIDGILHVQAKIVANQIESDNYTGEGFADTGYRLTSDDGTGSSALTVDNLHVRKKATFEELEVKKETAIAGNQVYSCAANVITRTDYYNGSGDIIGYSKISSPWLLKGLAIALGKRASNFKLFGRYKKVRVYLPDASQINYIRCYFLAKDGDREVENMWQAGKKDGERWQNHGNDLARCQTMNLKNSNRRTYISSVGEYKLGNVYWWRKVINVSSEPVTIDGQEYHYFDVAMGDCDAGSDIPAAGDHVVQFGNDSDPDRMNLIVLEVNGSDAPAEKFYEGIHNYNLNDCYYGGHTMKARLSPKAGYKFQGSKFEIVTEYAVSPVPIERGEWVRGTTYYYYDIVQHNGGTWLCVASTGNVYTVVEDIKNDYTVVYPKGTTLNQTKYNALTVSQKMLCTRTSTGSTTLEPTEVNSSVWRYYAEKGNGIVSITRTFAISNVNTTASETTEPAHRGSWSVNSPAVTEQYPYLWAKEVVVYTDTTKNTTKYYFVGGRGDNGIDAQDAEWVYVRTTTKTAPTIVAGSGTDYWKQDDFLPKAKVSNGRIKGDTEAGINVAVQCTDDPQGVDFTWKYEWEIKRTKGEATNGHREWNNYTPGKAMTLHNNLSESFLVTDIDNDADQFGTDSEGAVITQQKRSTIVSMYYGTQKQAFSSAPTTVLKYDDGTPASGNVPTTVATVSVTKIDNEDYKIEVTIKTSTGIFNTHNGMYVDITGTCSYGTQTMRFSLERVKSGAKGVDPVIYQLAPTQKTFSFSRDASNNLTPSSQSSKINVAKTEGNTTTILSSAQTGITYKWGYDDSTTAQETGKAVGTSISISNTNANSHNSVWVELTTGDRETLPIVKDGTNGADGNGIVSITRTFAISSVGTTSSETIEPSHQGSWTANSPSVTEQYPYLWAKEDVVFTDTTKNTTKYYCIGRRGDNGVDAQDIEWVYIRTKTNTAPTILNDNTYTDTNGKTYTSDDHLPQVSGNTNIENNQNKYQCTDDPKGVTEEWLYEWEIKRTKGEATNGRRSWNYYQGPMTLHNNFAQSAFIIDLDNDNDQFGTDSESKVLVTQTRSTTVAVYDGATQQTLNSLSVALTYEDGTSVASSVATSSADKTTGVVSVTVLQSNTAFSHEAINATITAEVTGKGTKKAVFTIRKVMSGQPGITPIIYQLAPTQPTFSFSRDASNNLTPTSRTSQINVAKTEGNTTTILSTAQSGITYKWGFDDSATATESNKAVGTSISVTNSDASSHYQVWVELSTGDRETLPIVKDGTNGANGNGIVSITTTYARSSQSSTASETTAPTIDGSWSSTMPTLTDTYKYLWRKEVTTYTDTSKNTTKYFLAAVKGQTGENGKDGWMVTADPSNVIITQSLGTDTTSFSTQAVTFSAKKGNNDATVTSVLINNTTDSKTKWYRFKGSVSGTTVTVSSPQPSGDSYYTEGYFTARVTVTDPDSNNPILFYITVPCYANLLGTWKESVENGVKTVIAEEVDYQYLDGVLTKNGRSYTQTATAAGNYETWSTQADTVNGSKANMIKKTTTAQQTADGVSTKVSAITAEVSGQTVLKESQVTQYADKITASVTDGLTNTGIDIEHGLINLQADKVVISNDLVVPTVISENDDMRTTIKAGKLKIESKKSTSYGIFEINNLNEIVLQMFDKDGKCVINLGGTPNALVSGKWENMEMRTLTSTELQNPSKANLTANAVGSSFKPCTMYYRLVLGKLTNSDNVLEYFLPDGTKTEDTTIINLDGCVFTAKSDYPRVIKQLGKISGHFVKRNNGIFRSTMIEVIEEDTQYEEDVYYYVSGKVNKILKKMFSN